jgi:DNA-binding NarL/FixJ family response regulator
MGKRILIVEDEIVSAMALETALAEMGYVVVGSVTTGEEAFDRAIGERPDIVAMDIRLAGKMDGIEAASRIIEATEAQIIFMTGYGDDETRKRALALKPLGVMSKPVDKSQFEKFK